MASWYAFFIVSVPANAETKSSKELFGKWKFVMSALVFDWNL